MLLILFSFFQPTSLLLHRQSSSATGANSALVATEELKDRILALAATAKVKRI